MTRFLFSTCFTILLLLTIVSCSIDLKIIDSSRVSSTLSFSDPDDFTFNSNYVEIRNNKVSLKPLDLKTSQDDFVNGQHVGTSANTFTGGVAAVNVDMSNIANVLPTREANMVGYWRFDGGFNGTRGADGSPVDGGAGLASVSGKVNEAILFDGIDDHVTYVSPTLTALSGLTWLRLDSFSNDYPRIFEIAGNFSVWVQRPTEPLWADYGSVYIRAVHGGVHGYWYSAPGTIEEGKLYHVAVSYDSSSNDNDPILMINGERIPLFLRERPVGVMSDTSGVGYIGDWGLSASRNWHGIMDEYSLFNVALSESEILEVYESQVNVSSTDTSLHETWTPKHNSVIGYWKMDGSWRDSSGHSNHGLRLDGATFTEDKKVGAQAGRFDGVGDGISLGSVSDYSSQNISVTAWIKVDELASLRGVSNIIWSNYQDANNRLYFFQSTNTDNLTLYGVLGGSAVISVDSGIVLEKDRWYHAAMTCSVADNISRLYIDGLSVGSSGVCSDIGINNQYLGIHQGTSQSFDGFLDDVALWKTTLTREQVFAIYHRQKQKFAAHYDSIVYDVGTPEFNWPGMSWSTPFPFGKALVGDFDSNGIPDAESVSHYSGLSSDLGSGLVGYWNFDETLVDGAPGGTDFSDRSGNNRHAEEFNGVDLTKSGQIISGIEADGLDDYVALPSGLGNFWSNRNGSVGFWFNANEDSFASRSDLYTAYTTSYGFSRVYIYTDATRNLKYRFRFCPACVNKDIVGPSIEPGHWYFMVVTIDSEKITLYLDGKEVGVLNDSFVPNENTQLSTLGGNIDDSNYFDGSFDELGLWSRSLSADEVLQLYRRGANRVKLQVKSCVDSSCGCKSFSQSPAGSINDCDGDGIANTEDGEDPHQAEFMGPGGEGTTFFSEIMNRRAEDITYSCDTNTTDSNDSICTDDEILLSGSPKPDSPLFSFASYLEASRLLPNRYFQYRVHMEADDNTACDGAPCLPELTSVSLNPSGTPKFYGQTQVVTSKNPIAFHEIKSLEIEESSLCARFLLSPDGQKFYSFTDTAWTEVFDSSSTLSAHQVSENIVSFSRQFAPATLYFKVFLTSEDGQTPCSVGKMSLDYRDENVFK